LAGPARPALSQATAPREPWRGSPLMENYDNFKRIGRGNYGTVFLARDVRNGKFYCLKQVQMDTYSDQERETAVQECEVLRTLDHPGIVRYREHFLHGDCLCVVMTYCEGGDLAATIKKRAKAEQRFTEAEVLDWFVQLVMALHHVHGKKILHRDLKTQNIFITKNLVKVCPGCGGVVGGGWERGEGRPGWGEWRPWGSDTQPAADPTCPWPRRAAHTAPSAAGAP
jgi:hypothetical protein